MDGRPYEARAQPIGTKEIVDAPPCITLTCAAAIAPPAVGTFQGWKEIAERIREARREKCRHFFTLLVGKTRIAAVGGRILEVYLLVGYVHVAADNDGFQLVKFRDVRQEIIFPPHAVVQATQAVLGVGHVHVDKEVVFKFQRHRPPFVAVFVHADSTAHTERFLTGKYCGSAVPFFLRIVPVALITWEFNVQLAFLHLRFLYAKDVSIQAGEGVTKSFSVAGPKAIDIP